MEMVTRFFSEQCTVYIHTGIDSISHYLSKQVNQVISDENFILGLYTWKECGMYNPKLPNLYRAEIVLSSSKATCCCRNPP